MRHRYAGQRAVLLTQHGKQALMAPVLEDMLGCRLERAQGFDTDTLGTFARDVPREGTQLQAARRKARMALDLTGCRLGLGSEGSFVADPYTGLMPWNIELVVWLDDESGLEVCGVAQGPARNVQRLVHDVESLETLAREAGFPEHRLMLRPDHDHDARIVKGLQDRDALLAAFDAARQSSRSGKVFVESDLRAHCNPTRQNLIRAATQDLAAKLNSACPRCDLPGFSATAAQEFCPCERCGTPTRLPRSALWSCLRCGYNEARAIAGRQQAAASVCDRCNP